MTNLEIAQIISNQLGGNKRLSTMIGAKDFTAIENGFAFKYPTAKYCNITLNGSDTYDIEFKSIRGMKVKELSSYKDIYAEDLKKTFEKETGLYLSL